MSKIQSQQPWYSEVLDWDWSPIYLQSLWFIHPDEIKKDGKDSPIYIIDNPEIKSPCEIRYFLRSDLTNREKYRKIIWKCYDASFSDGFLFYYISYLDVFSLWFVIAKVYYYPDMDDVSKYQRIVWSRSTNHYPIIITSTTNCDRESQASHCLNSKNCLWTIQKPVSQYDFSNLKGVSTEQGCIYPIHRSIYSFYQSMQSPPNTHPDVFKNLNTFSAQLKYWVKLYLIFDACIQPTSVLKALFGVTKSFTDMLLVDNNVQREFSEWFLTAISIFNEWMDHYTISYQQFGTSFEQVRQKLPPPVQKNSNIFQELLKLDQQRAESFMNVNDNLMKDYSECLVRSLYSVKGYISWITQHIGAVLWPLEEYSSSFEHLISKSNVETIIAIGSETNRWMYWNSLFTSGTSSYIRKQYSSIPVFLNRPKSPVLHRIVYSGQDGQEKSLQIIHFSHWPDGSVPGPDLDLEINYLVHLILHSNDSKKILIHCVAGQGRTGTLILLTVARAIIKLGIPWNLIRDWICLRRMRPNMIHSAEQLYYVLTHLFDPNTDSFRNYLNPALYSLDYSLVRTNQTNRGRPSQFNSTHNHVNIDNTNNQVSPSNQINRTSSILFSNVTSNMNIPTPLNTIQQKDPVLSTQLITNVSNPIVTKTKKQSSKTTKKHDQYLHMNEASTELKISGQIGYTTDNATYQVWNMPNQFTICNYVPNEKDKCILIPHLNTDNAQFTEWMNRHNYARVVTSTDGTQRLMWEKENTILIFAHFSTEDKKAHARVDRLCYTGKSTSIRNKKSSVWCMSPVQTTLEPSSSKQKNRINCFIWNHFAILSVTSGTKNVQQLDYMICQFLTYLNELGRLGSHNFPFKHILFVVSDLQDVYPFQTYSRQYDLCITILPQFTIARLSLDPAPSLEFLTTT